MALETKDLFRKGNFQWNEFKSWGNSNPQTKRRKDPKPDLTYGFPMIPPQKDPSKDFLRGEYIQSFSLNVLRELHLERVYSAPTTGLRRWTDKMNDDDLKGPDWMCYP